MLGSAVLYGTDYFRAALNLGLKFFLVHDPGSGRTVLDRQYVNPELTNYLRVWLSLDTMVSGVLSMIDNYLNCISKEPYRNSAISY